jgi:hypothetical protein
MWNRDEAFTNKAIIWSAAAVVLIAGGGLYYYYAVRNKEPAPVAAAPAKAPPPAVPAEPEIQNPVPEEATPASKPLPALNDSDAEVTERLAKAVGAGPVAMFLTPQNVVRRIVVTVDNLPRKKLAVEMRGLKPIGGQTVVNEQGDSVTLSPDNYARYAALIKAVQGTDTKQLTAAYFRLYPLFQQAYEDLGYPGQYFNDRVVQVIDHLLETPSVRAPVPLTQPKVFYEYADPALESRSAGQKTLMRMGPENADAIKQKLREIRAAIAAHPHG